MASTLHILAPAKINLTLAVTGRDERGYHLLDSLVAFADIGDQIVMEPAAPFGFQVRGPFARAFTAQELEAGPHSKNIAVRAAHDMARAAGRELNCRITLTKNLPLASGIGGGSADAGAVIWGLMEMWDLGPGNLEWLPALCAALGADVPVCLECRPVRMRGIGERLDPMPGLPELAVLLVNPGVPCATGAVFQRFNGRPFTQEQDWPEAMDRGALMKFLIARGNDLMAPAVECVPEIAFALDALGMQEGCELARMSGSGATCFGIFSEMEQAMEAAEILARRHPAWWIRAGTLNRPSRY